MESITQPSLTSSFNIFDIIKNIKSGKKLLEFYADKIDTELYLILQQHFSNESNQLKPRIHYSGVWPL